MAGTLIWEWEDRGRQLEFQRLRGSETDAEEKWNGRGERKTARVAGYIPAKSAASIVMMPALQEIRGIEVSLLAA